MVRGDFRAPRLYVPVPLSASARVALTPAQANYLGNVLRRKPGDAVLIFNGEHGEWRAEIESDRRRSFALVARECVRPQPVAAGLRLLFAPLKHARLDYMVQKAVEMGASHLQPVLTRHTQVERLNSERMRANAIEAAEQCGILSLPEIGAARKLDQALAELDFEQLLIFCDEDAEESDPLQALRAVEARAENGPAPAVLVGPEGGFAPEERDALIARANTLRLSLGPRILRADTAAVAALAIVQAALGDWRAGREIGSAPD